MRPCFALALVVPFFGCTFDGGLPTGAHTACTSSAGCGAGERCLPRTHLCTLDEKVAPEPIADLAVDEARSTATSLTLTWTAPGDDGSTAGTRADLYRLRRWQPGAPDDVDETTLGITPGLAFAVETARVDGLAAGTLYNFAVVAVDDNDNASTSNTAAGATLGAVTCHGDVDCPAGQFCAGTSCTASESVPPGPITDLGVDVTRTGETSVILTWTSPGDDGFEPGTAAAHYRVDVTDPVAGAVTFLDLDDVPSPAFSPALTVVDGLNRATAYTFTIEATDDAGNTSISNTVSAETGGGACALDESGVLTATGSFRVVSAEQLVRLVGCQRIEGSLTIDDASCGLVDLSLLTSLDEVTGTVEMIENPLCPAGGALSLVGVKRAGKLLVTDLGGVDLTFAALEQVHNIEIDFNVGDVAVHLPQLVSVDGEPDPFLVSDNTGGVHIDAASLRSVPQIELDPEADSSFLAPALTRVDAIGGLINDGATLTISLDALQTVGNVDFRGGAVAVNAPALVYASALNIQSDASSFALPSLVGCANATLQGHISDVALPALRSCKLNIAKEGDVAVPFALPSLDDGDVEISGSGISSVSLPAMARARTILIENAPLLTSVSLPSLVEAQSVSVSSSAALTSFDAPALVAIDDGLTISDGALTSVALPSLTTVGANFVDAFDACIGTGSLDIAGLKLLTDVELPALERTGQLDVDGVPALRNFDVPLLSSGGPFHVVAPAMETAAVAAITARLGCAVPPLCGNGTLDAGEQCDDGNTSPGDGCGVACARECGDGVVTASEQCDDGNALADDGCEPDCTATCGVDRSTTLAVRDARGHCLETGAFLFGAVATFDDASAQCAAAGGSVAVPGDLDEDVFLLAELRASGAWLGLEDRAVSGRFVKPDGSDLGAGFTFFRTGAPDDAAPGASCVFLRDDATWDVDSCDAARAFVCDVP